MSAVRLPVACEAGATLKVAIQGVAADGLPDGIEPASRTIPALAKAARGDGRTRENQPASRLGREMPWKGVAAHHGGRFEGANLKFVP